MSMFSKACVAWSIQQHGVSGSSANTIVINNAKGKW
jgi:hypothetical protein